MTLLLETAAGQANQTGAIIVGLLVFAGLLGLLALLLGFGSGRPHAANERE